MIETIRLSDPVLLIRVPRTFRPGMSDVELYQATRGVWRIGKRRDHIKYVFAVYQGVVQEVYEILRWQPAHTTPYRTRQLDAKATRDRWEFVGRCADDKVRSKYVGKSVADYFAKGAQNPITYVNVPK